jgi:hypothetical protein
MRYAHIPKDDKPFGDKSREICSFLLHRSMTDETKAVVWINKIITGLSHCSASSFAVSSLSKTVDLRQSAQSLMSRQSLRFPAQR